MNPPIASRKRRIVAQLIDFTFFSYLASLFMYLIFFLLKTPWDTPLLHNSLSLISAFGILGFLIFAAKDSYNGLGIGKLIMGIRVYDAEGRPANVLSSFIRNLPLLAWPVETIVMIISSSKKRIGDQLVDTQVCRDKQINPMNRWLAVLLILCSYWMSPNLPDLEFSESGIIKLSQMVVKQSHAFELAEKRVRSESAIINLIGPVQSIDVRITSNIVIHNDEGKAEFSLDVVGERGQLPVIVNLERKNSQWQVVQMHFEQVQNIEF
jgi:uncharacterized RDD family membrane protein YckC